MSSNADRAASSLSTQEKPYRAEVCNICGSSKYRKVHYFKEWNTGRNPVRDVSIVRCGRCKVRRRMPGVIDSYEGDYHATYEDQGPAMHPHEIYHFADLLTARLPELKTKGLTFLDVGCSTGRVLRLARMLGFEPTGLDISRWAADYCTKQGFPARSGSLIGQWREPGVFDVIYSSHTIEHLEDPLAYLREMRRLLKPNGHLMLACPNYASLPRLVYRDRWIWQLDSHLWQFTAKQVHRLLVENGFCLVLSRTRHGYAVRAAWKKWLLDRAANLGFGDGLQLIAAPC